MSDDSAETAEPRLTRLLRVAEHIRTQNWTAIGIDFLIVVLGVFVGIQVANWNESRADRARERMLLGELRAEITESIRVAEGRRAGFEQITRSGERALAFLDAGTECGTACWPIVVDFFHASQWQPITTELKTYEELRRSGWPSNRGITRAVDFYLFNTSELQKASAERPAYRALVRGLIPVAIHQTYWTRCHLVDVAEVYVENCPEGADPRVSAAAVQSIRSHPDVHRTLTEWVGFTYLVAAALDRQNEAGRQALQAIDAEFKALP
jgi:hypothetical protein